MKTQIQLILSTIALTILIWTYADQAGHDTYTTTVLVKYTGPPQPGNPVVLRVAGAQADAPDLIRVEVTLRGPKSAVRRLEKDDASGRFSLAVVVTNEMSPGRQPPRDVFNDLSRLPEIRNRGLVLQKVSPATVTLEVDRYKNVDVDVELLTGAFEKLLSGKPIVKPEKVTARVLESKLEQGRTLPPLRLSIEDELQARSEQAGGTFSFDLPLRSTWPGIDATFAPDHVRVTARLTRRTVRERITLIPLSVLVKVQNFFGRYDIQWQDETGGHLMQAIDVRVPLEKAGQLKGSMVDAYVTIDDADLPKELPGAPSTEPASSPQTWIERDVRFVFPPGFEDVKVEGPPRTVKFRIVKRKADAASPLPTLSPSAVPTLSPTLLPTTLP